jgi:ABC-type molybdate transport system permease subunit
VLIFTGAYLMEKTQGQRLLNLALRMLSFIPMAVPGLVLGLGYVFFFNLNGNPLHVLYGSMTLLVVCTIAHYLTTAQMTATTALRQLDGEFEAAALSLKAPLYKHFLRVTVPICLPALLDIVRYLFVSGMTTVSAAIFLYSPDTILAAVAVLNMDDAGNVGGAAAMSTLILLTRPAPRCCWPGFARLAAPFPGLAPPRPAIDRLPTTTGTDHVQAPGPGRCCIRRFSLKASAAATELTVYTALEAEQLKSYKQAFEKANPDVEIKWVRDSTGIITAKLLAEKTARRPTRCGAWRLPAWRSSTRTACSKPTRRRTWARSAATTATPPTRRPGSAWTCGPRPSASTPSKPRNRA